MYAHTMLIKTALLHQSSGPCVFLSLSLSLSLSLFFRLIPWSAEALWVQFPVRASKTLSRRRSEPSPHREGTWGLCEKASPVPGPLLAFCVNQGISASFSLLYFPIGRLWTTRFRSIKGTKQYAPKSHQGQLRGLPGLHRRCPTTLHHSLGRWAECVIYGRVRQRGNVVQWKEHKLLFL